jgi:hypothetical protein
MTEDDRFILRLIEKYALDQYEDAYICGVYQRLKEQLVAERVAERFDQANKSDNAS